MGMLTSPLTSPSLDSGWSPAHLFFLLKKFGSAGQHPTQAKPFACFSRAKYKNRQRFGGFCILRG